MDAQTSIGTASGDGFLEVFYRQYRSMLCGYVRRHFGSGPPDPEEVAQAAFARYAELADRDEVRNPEAYLKRIAANIVMEAHRRTRRTARIHHDIEILEQQHREFSPEDILSSKEELERLDHAIALLKPKQRVALLLHRIDGLSFVEIAREMNVSQSGARLLVDTALANCAATMRKGARR